jgi:hypothetical protein
MTSAHCERNELQAWSRRGAISKSRRGIEESVEPPRFSAGFEGCLIAALGCAKAHADGGRIVRIEVKRRPQIPAARRGASPGLRKSPARFADQLAALA